MMAYMGRLLLILHTVTCCMSVMRCVHSAPIRITRWTLNNCQKGVSFGEPVNCCPPKPVDEPIVNFKPQRDASKPLRVRKALQCLQGKELETYTKKLQKGYALMRALPHSDPRSLKRQNEIHCANGRTESLLQSPFTNITLDIHFNWLFLPWHRVFVYFHERILQKLLNDPGFSLHFWNFDNSVTNTSAGSDGCYTPGHFFPPIYNDPEESTFESNRSSRVFEAGRITDLSWDSTLWNQSAGPPVFENYTVAEQISRNRETMHTSLVDAHTSFSFFGRKYRLGDQLGFTDVGAIEMYPHTSVHQWVGGFHQFVHTAPADPIFYPLHANVERLWSVWRTLGKSYVDPTDPDWLDATFLLWDENAVLRRMKVRDLVDIEAFGYTYEHVNDASWIFCDNSASNT